MNSIISEKTMIPLSMVVVFVGGVFWLTSMYSEVKASSIQINELKASQLRKEETLEQILQRLTAIETELKRLRR